MWRSSKALNAWALPLGEAYERLVALAESGVEVKMLQQPECEYEHVRLFSAYQSLRSSRQPVDGGIGGIPLSESAYAFDRFALVEILDLDEWLNLVSTMEKQAWDWHEANKPKS